jgi:hypothetical protein
MRLDGGGRTVASAPELAARALELANRCIDSSRDELLELAGDDREAVTAATQILRGMNTDRPEIERTSEHFAFALLSSVFSAQRRRMEDDSPSG